MTAADWQRLAELVYQAAHRSGDTLIELSYLLEREAADAAAAEALAEATIKEVAEAFKRRG